MWTIIGRRVDAKSFPAFRPLRVLYEFDGPRTFTVLDADGELFLAHWSDEDEVSVRYIVVPFSNRHATRLERGEVTVYDALDQPRIFVADVESGGVVRILHRVEWVDIPADAKPEPGFFLHPRESNSNRGKGDEALAELVGS